MKKKLIYGIGALAVCLLIQYFIFSNFTCADCMVDFPAKAAQLRLDELSRNLWSFREKCGRFPTSKEGLEVLANKVDCYGKTYPAISQPIGKDPWNNEWAFISDGHAFKLGTYGADGKVGGEFTATDLWVNSDLEPVN